MKKDEERNKKRQLPKSSLILANFNGTNHVKSV